MPSNCNECGKDTPSKIYICHPCLNDEDFADYRTEWEIWEEKMYWEDVKRMEEDEQERLFEIDYWKDYEREETNKDLRETESIWEDFIETEIGEIYA